jgi:hypothetical protein
MTVIDQVRALIEHLAPKPICDDCVVKRLGLSVRQHANNKTRDLAGSKGLELRKDICSICFCRKLVTRRETDVEDGEDARHDAVDQAKLALGMR